MIELIVACWIAQDNRPKQDDRKITPEEVERRKVEAFKDAEEAYKKFRAWTAAIQIRESVPMDESSIYTEGTVWCRSAEEKWMLYWEGKQYGEQIDENQVMKKTPLDSVRSLYKGPDLLEALDTTKVLKIYRFEETIDMLLPQLLVRDGFVKTLEKHFEVNIIANARYQKIAPNAEDLGHLGFKSVEEMNDWWKKTRARGSGGAETTFSEHRPFKDREDKMDRDNPRNKGENYEGGAAQFFYAIQLTPITPELKRNVRRVILALRPGDFLPTSIKIFMTNDQDVLIRFQGIVKDPAGDQEIKEERFRLEAPDHRKTWPQKE